MRRPVPPFPELLRRPTGSFGWLEDRLLHEGWLARLGPDATSVMVLLALAADGHGASFFGRERMAKALGLDRQAVDRALRRLLELELVAQRPWSQDHPDGVWQLLTPRRRIKAATGTFSIQQALAALGF